MKPLITDSPSTTDNLPTTDSCRGTDCFCHIYSVFLTSEIRTTSILRTTDNADGPERWQLYKITSESGRKSKPWVKISTHCYSAAPRKTVKWFDSVRVVSIQSVSCIITLQATPPIVNLIPIRDLRIEGRGLLANLLDKDNLSTVDKTPAPDVSVIWRFHYRLPYAHTAALIEFSETYCCLVRFLGTGWTIMILYNLNRHLASLNAALGLKD